MTVRKMTRRTYATVGMLTGVACVLTATVSALSDEARGPEKDAGMFQDSRTVAQQRVVRIGPGIPAHLGLPVLPPVTLDYRKDFATEARAKGEAIVIGGGRVERTAGAVASGQGCFNDIECDDCDPCTIDACSGSECVGGVLDGARVSTLDDHARVAKVVRLTI